MKDKQKANDHLIEELEEMPKVSDELQRSEIDRSGTQIGPWQSQQAWVQTFDAVPDLIATLDTSFQITHANKAMADRLGLTTEECVGQMCFRIVHGMDQPPSFCPFVRLLKDGQEHTAEVKEEGLGGYFIISASPLMGENGQVTGCVHVARDISERKQAEDQMRESERKYRELADSLPQTVAEFDEKGNLTFVNRNSFEMFGYNTEDVDKDLNLFQMIAPEDHARARENIQKVLCGKKLADDQYLGVRKDGTTFPISVFTSVVVYENKPVGLRAIVIDNTERKQAEEELKKHRNHLEQTIEERTAELQGSKEELEIKTKTLEEVNIALKVLLRQIEEDKKDLEERFAQNIKQLILPYVEKVKKGRLDPPQYTCLSIIETNLNEIVSPFLHSLRQFNFTPRETQIASLIKDGKTTKEIADTIGVAPSAVDTYRNKIRHKLNLNNKKINLQSYLQSMK